MLLKILNGLTIDLASAENEGKTHEKCEEVAHLPDDRSLRMLTETEPFEKISVQST